MERSVAPFETIAKDEAVFVQPMPMASLWEDVRPKVSGPARSCGYTD